MISEKHFVLIIDDHPLITEAYITALNYYSKHNETVEFSIQTANDCDSGRELIKKVLKSKEHKYIVFLDIKLPPSRDGEILSGEDLGLLIRELLPNPRIIVSTTFNDNFRVHSILKNINPEGFLIKNDITPLELLETIRTVVNDPPYYSKTVIKLLRDQVVNEFILDHYDRKILYELSVGTRMKDLPKLLPLSIAAIEKRKRNLKLMFNVRKLDDRQLMVSAKEKGFI
jgi:DNA-binding NarL/FixJ family response regulator|tara:strand:+ start:1672 stop:2355 length:684 start_codon:yes stop_codon:yes gene_type:complete